MSDGVAPTLPQGVRTVAEEPLGAFPLYSHGAWRAEASWLLHGVTGRDADMSVFGSSPAGGVLGRWAELREALGTRTIVHARQVHGAAVHEHAAAPPGILLAPDADGHATAAGGLLLAVSVADCVPVYLVAPAARAVALVHAGWRGTAAGIVERATETLERGFGAAPQSLLLHCGPAICGSCYEVGPEVPSMLGLAGAPGRVDLRAVIVHRARAAGVPLGAITVSAHCTRCGGSPFYSHRAGCAERQLAVLGIRAA